MLATQIGCNGSFGRFFDPMGIFSPQVDDSAITVQSTGKNSVTFSFAQATDRETPPSGLQYLIVYSTIDDLETITDYTALPSGAAASGGWQAYPSSATVTGLIPSTKYYFNVIVKNQRDRFTLYTSASASTVFVTAPAVSDGILTLSAISTTRATISFSAATDAITDPALEYRVIYSAVNNLSSITDYNILPAGVTVFSDWLPYPSPVTITTLSPSTAYYFNVLVKNGDGAFSLYTTATSTTLASAAPVLSTSALTFSGVDVNSVTFSWSAASDALTAAADLRYLVVYSKSDDLGTITDYNNLPADAAKFGDWQAYPASVTVTGLTMGTQYHFNVLVRNDLGLISRYTSGAATPDDVTPPVPSSLDITTSGITTTEITVSWSSATDNVTTVPADLRYKVVCSSIESIDQVQSADALTGDNVIQNWSPYGTGSLTATGLSLNTTYYFNVLVRDTRGNMTLYTCTSATTAASTEDTQAPTISNPAVTAAPGADAYHATLAWSKAHDEQGDGTKYTSDDTLLEYRVVASSSAITEATFGNATVLTNTSGTGWTANIETLANIAVADGVTTYFMVAVRDEAGKVAYYTPASYAPASVKSTLQCYYNLDNNVTDSSSYSMAATTTGTATYSTNTPSGTGASYSFAENDNNAKSIAITNISTFDSSIKDKISISIWIKVNTFTNNWEQIISKGAWGFRVQRYSDTNYLYFQVVHNLDTSAYSRVISKTAIADNKWHHVVCIFSTGGSVGNERIFMYIDGVNQSGSFPSDKSGDVYTNSPIYYTNTATTYKVRFGCNEDTKDFSGQEYTGLLDEVRIYNTVLTDEEIQALGR